MRRSPWLLRIPEANSHRGSATLSLIAVATLGAALLAQGEDTEDAPSDGLPPRHPVGTAERPLVVRTPLPRLGVDGAADDAASPLTSTITVSFGDQLSLAWDTVECRWLYAWRGGFLDMAAAWSPDSTAAGTPALVGELAYLASGPSTLEVAIGAAGETRFYGYRMVDGAPEFLYTMGRLKVAERITPGDDGKSIVQHFSVERNPGELMIALPPAAAAAATEGAADPPTPPSTTVELSHGERSGDYAVIDARHAADFTLTHTIGATLPLPRSEAPKTDPLPLLTQTPPVPKPADNPPAPEPADMPPAPKPEDPSQEPKPAGMSPSPKPEDPPQEPKVADVPPSPRPEGAPPEPKEAEPTTPPIAIAKAERYDRDILLTDPQVAAGALKAEAMAFSDREFAFAQLPDELVGADYVRTYDRDKYIPGDLLSYRVEFERDAVVYLLFDTRLKRLPAWIDKRFRDTGETATLDPDKTFRVLRAEVEAGALRFGPQDSGAGAHFYIIAATPRPDSEGSGASKDSE